MHCRDEARRKQRPASSAHDALTSAAAAGEAERLAADLGEEQLLFSTTPLEREDAHAHAQVTQLLGLPHGYDDI